ncbi:tetratricopeptide repeat-containing glycosyltransferase family 2 protein [Paenibacillus dokdonensis]|uniref:tetratricopeptide repeat-containing glycosyltransferase family 2 protein n=1 Tax=Paenibacillus dokdonensis TaxID=2567944 RepID=UPI001FE4271A|nr:glycosyltransferase [Paenibacillus dokdonensis]
MGKTVSLVMIVKNEGSILKRCLESASKLVDEIIIVDTGSTDNTKEIAREFNAEVFDYTWNNDFSEARNYALDRSTSEWNLVLDADEYISNDCKDTIRLFIEQNQAIGRVKRIDKFQGQDGINYEQIYISRLFPASYRYSGKIHEQIKSDLPRLIVDVEVQHDGYFQQSKNERNIPILQSVLREHPLDPYYHHQIAKEYRGLEDHEKAYDHLKIAYDNMTGREGYAPSIIVNLLYAIISTGQLSEGITIIEEQFDYLQNYPDFFFVAALYLLELILSAPDQFGELLPLIERYYKRALEIGDNGQEGSVLGTGSFATLHNLGVFYEVTGEFDQACDCYEQAAEMNYKPSIDRLKIIKS